MRSPYWLVAILTGLPVLVAWQEPHRVKGELPFGYSLESALSQAEENGKPVLAYFTFETCAWCKRLEVGSFSDPAVLAFSDRFNWVVVDRDVDPAVPRKFAVSGYPSMLVLDAKARLMHRWSGFSTTPFFTQNLRDGLDRFEKMKRGEEWILPPDRSERLIENVRTEAIEIPAPEKQPNPRVLPLRSLTWHDGRLWYTRNAERGKVLGIDPGEKSAPLEIDLGEGRSVNGLCSDGRNLFGLPYGWTKGEPILEIDPKKGEVIREIITRENLENRHSSGFGLAWCQGVLFVLDTRASLSRVSPKDGSLLGELRVQRPPLSQMRIQAVASDGDRLWIGVTGKDPDVKADAWDKTVPYLHAVLQTDPQSGRVLGKQAVNYEISALASHRKTLYLAENVVTGFDADHDLIAFFPKEWVIHSWRWR
ncbi:MAG: thioredoxin family protein [Planctomycetota bacterium]